MHRVSVGSEQGNTLSIIFKEVAEMVIDICEECGKRAVVDVYVVPQYEGDECGLVLSLCEDCINKLKEEGIEIKPVKVPA